MKRRLIEIIVSFLLGFAAGLLFLFHKTGSTGENTHQRMTQAPRNGPPLTGFDRKTGAEDGDDDLEMTETVEMEQSNGNDFIRIQEHTLFRLGPTVLNPGHFRLERAVINALQLDERQVEQINASIDSLCGDLAAVELNRRILVNDGDNAYYQIPKYSEGEILRKQFSEAVQSILIDPEKSQLLTALVTNCVYLGSFGRHSENVYISEMNLGGQATPMIRRQIIDDEGNIVASINSRINNEPLHKRYNGFFPESD